MTIVPSSSSFASTKLAIDRRIFDLEIGIFHKMEDLTFAFWHCFGVAVVFTHFNIRLLGTLPQ